jgi:hypothetical protein
VYMHSIFFVKISQLSKVAAKAQKAWVRPLGPAPLPLFASLLEDVFSQIHRVQVQKKRGEARVAPPFSWFYVGTRIGQRV